MKGVRSGGGQGAALQVLHSAMGMIAFQVLALLAGILIARKLGPELQGRFQLTLSITLFISMLAKLGLDDGITYLIPKYQLENAGKIYPLIKYATMITIVVSLLIGAIFFIGASFLEAYFFKIPGLAADLRYQLLLFPSLMLLVITCAALRGLEQINARSYIYYYGVSILFLAAILLFSLGRGLTIEKAFIARIVTFAAGAAAAWIFILKVVPHKGGKLERGEIRKLHSFSGLMIFVSAFQYLVEQPMLNLIIVGRYTNATQVGLYSVAARLGAVVALGATALNLVAAPHFAKALAAKDFAGLRAKHRNASKAMAAFSLAGGVIALIFQKQLLGLFGHEYVAATPYLLPFVLGYMASGVLGLNSPLLIAAGYVKIEFILTATACAIFLVAALQAVHKFGGVGVAWATSGTIAGLSVARYFVARRLFARKINFQKEGNG